MRDAIARLFAVGHNSRAVDVGLLSLRIMVTTSLIYHHGLSKVFEWQLLTTHPTNDPIGIGIVPSLIFAGFTDLFCAVLVLFGFATRIASFFCAITLATVCFIIDRALMPPFWPAPHSGRGELTWIYMAIFITLMFAGPGLYSLDSKLGWGKSTTD